jgi:lipoprotein-anchoring transpeptidase ErfK/SrfK
LIPESPELRIEKARQAISDAKKAQAHIYAPKKFREAERVYDSMLMLWKFENNKFILSRKYDHIDTCVKLILEKASQAKNTALANSQNLEISVQAEISKLTAAYKKNEKLIKILPLKKTVTRNFENGRMLLSEAKIDNSKKNLLTAKDKLNKSSDFLHKATSEVNDMLRNYFSDFSKWKEWNKITIENSRNSGKIAIVVDKVAKMCYVYKKGRLKESFSIELGKNWMGNKLMKGDKTTPEGIYKITKKLDSRKTKYYKALLINYPNEEDKARFKQNKKTGTIPKKALIGGLIEIHGDGGKGTNWTDGCVALKNEDMDIIYKMVEIGTMVTIVGSLKSLSDLMDL